METDLIEKFLKEYTELKSIYDSAQETFVKEQRVDNEKYIHCINKSGELIKYLDNLNQFVLQRNKEQIKMTYFISAELLIRTVGIYNGRQAFN